MQSILSHDCEADCRLAKLIRWDIRIQPKWLLSAELFFFNHMVQIKSYESGKVVNFAQRLGDSCLALEQLR